MNVRYVKSRSDGNPAMDTDYNVADTASLKFTGCLTLPRHPPIEDHRFVNPVCSSPERHSLGRGLLANESESLYKR
jgi:hypothetical protein